MASLVDRVLPMLSQSVTISSKLSSLQTSDVVSISVLNAPSLVSFPAVSLPPPLIYCGRGDKKTAKGKRFRHSFGNAWPRNKKKGRGPPRPPMPSSPSKKDRSDDDDC